MSLEVMMDCEEFRVNTPHLFELSYNRRSVKSDRGPDTRDNPVIGAEPLALEK